MFWRTIYFNIHKKFFFKSASLSLIFLTVCFSSLPSVSFSSGAFTVSSWWGEVLSVGRVRWRFRECAGIGRPRRPHCHQWWHRLQLWCKSDICIILSHIFCRLFTSRESYTHSHCCLHPPYQLPSNKESSFRKTWTPKYTLRSHFDGVRALAFHPVEPCLVTVSEDHTLKLWNLTKTVPAKKYDIICINSNAAFEGSSEAGKNPMVKWYIWRQCIGVLLRRNDQNMEV